MDIPLGSTLPKRFWDKVKVNENTGCWEWQAKVTNTGYGLFYLKGKWKPAHRQAYESFYGELNELDALHHCDNRKCVRVQGKPLNKRAEAGERIHADHIYPGNDSMNQKDSWRRRRRTVGIKDESDYPRGSRLSDKLTETDVVELRQLAKDGVSFASLGRKYSLSAEHIATIVYGKSWKHVPLAELNRPRHIKYRRKLNPEIIEQMRFLHEKENLSYTEIGRRFNLHRKTVSKALQGKTWNDKTNALRRNRKLTESQVQEIYQLLKNGAFQTDVAEQFNVSGGTINCIATGRHWSHITGIKYIPMAQKQN